MVVKENKTSKVCKKKKRAPYKLDHSKLPPYTLPRVLGWHLLTKQPRDTGKIYKYFGYSWWDLLYLGKLGLKEGKITMKTKHASSIIFINMGVNNVIMTNKQTGDVYNVLKGSKAIVNNTNNKVVTFQADSKKVLINLTKISNVWLILLNIQDLKKGKSKIKDTPLMKDFLLMNGIADKDQYLYSVGIENFPLFDTQGWEYIDTIDRIKSEFSELLLQQWDVCNPGKSSKPKSHIPLKLHWIWLSLDHKGKSFGKIKSRFYKFMDTWINKNPEFEFNIWTDNPDFYLPDRYCGTVNVRGPDDITALLKKLPKNVEKEITYLVKNHPNVGGRSDCIRQVVLYEEGGLYSDINDGACLVSMKKMCEKFDYLIGMEPVMYVNNAIMGGKRHHPIFQGMIAWLAYNSRSFVIEWKNDYAGATQDEKDDYIVGTTGPIALTSIIFGILESNPGKLEHSLFLPSAWVYPNYWMPTSPIEWLKPISFCAHYDLRDYLK